MHERQPSSQLDEQSFQNMSMSEMNGSQSIMHHHSDPLPNSKSKSSQQSQPGLINRQKFITFTQNLTSKVYRKGLKKFVFRYLPQNLIKRKIIQSLQQIDLEKYLKSYQLKAEDQIDRLDFWIRNNILENKEVIRFQEQCIESEKIKEKKLEELNKLIIQISQKQKQKKIQQIIAQFTKKRAQNYRKFQPNPQVDLYHEKIKKKIAIKDDQLQDLSKKAEDFINNYMNKLQISTGVKLDKIDKFIFH